MFNSLENVRRKWAIPAMWVLLSLFWLAFGIEGVVEHKPFRRGWLLVGAWGLVMIFWLYHTLPGISAWS